MSIVITPQTVRLRIDQKQTFEVTDEGTAIEIATWACDPPDAGTLVDGELTPNPDAPHATFQVKATPKSGGPDLVADVTIVLVWREGWPRLGPGWANATPKGVTTWLARALYDVMTYIPEPLAEAIGDIEIEYIGALPGKGGQYQWSHVPTHRIEIPQATLDGTFDTGSTLTTTGTPNVGGYRRLCDLLLHEMSHTAMMNLCGGPLMAWAEYAGEILDIVQQFLVAATPWLIVPLLPLELILSGHEAAPNLVSEYDYVSYWSKASGWVMNNLEALKIPLIGGLVSWLTTQSPNWATGASQTAWYTGLRNLKQTHNWTTLERMIVHDKISNPQTPADHATNATIDATVNTAVNAAEMPSAYAHASPLEDFADSIVIRLRTDTNDTHLWYARHPLSKNRSDFLEQKLVPKTWTAKAGRYQLAAFQHHEIDHTLMATKAANDGGAKATATAARVFAALAAWEEGDGRVIATTRQAAREVFKERELESSLEVAKIAEAHGGGLARFDHAPAEPGDLLLGGERAVYIALTTDDRGRVQRAGGHVGVRRGMKPEDVQPDRSSLRLQWRPGTERRVYARAEDASPAYADIDATVHALVERWGETRDPTSKRDLSTVHGFFQHVMATGNLHDEPATLSFDDVDDVRAHLRIHGEGLEPFGPTDRCQVGDVLVPYHHNTIAIVTRVDEHGAPVDVLEGGQHEPGGLGENASAVKLYHGVDRNDYHYRWSPSKTARTWIHGGAMSELFDDLNTSLNNVVAQVGRGRLRRDGDDNGVNHWTPFQLFAALMLEKSPSETARTLNAKIGWKAGGREVRNFFYTHGEVGARGECRPGDFILWRDRAGSEHSGVVITVSNGGEPTRTAVIEDDRIALDETTVAPSSIYERCRPSMQPRVLHDSPEMAQFYGVPSVLWQMLGRRGRAATETHTIDGKSVTLHYNDVEDVVQLAALAAPGWLQLRLRKARGVAGIRRVLDSVGQGTTVYAREAVPLGAWLFFGDKQLGFLIANGDDGAPATMYGMGDGTFDFVPVDIDHLTHVWLPDTIARKVTDHSNPEAYTYLDAEIGRLRAWQGFSDTSIANYIPFWDERWSQEAYVTEEVARVLERMPEDWNAAVVYVNGYGDGAVPGDQARPGDVLFLESGFGVALDKDEMIWWRPSGNYAVRIEPRAKVRFTWRPSARARADR